MIPVTNDYIANVVAQSRLFRSRATITMDAFSQLAPITDSIITSFLNKIQGSTVENPNKAKFVKNTAIQVPTAVSWTSLTQGYYNAIMTADNNPFDIYSSISGQYCQILFQFDLVTLFERQYGPSYWQGATTAAEKATILKQYIQNGTFKWKGYGYGVSQAGTPYQPAVTTYDSVRYIRDYLNGNSVNLNNYWNEIQAMSGATNRAATKTPTISSGTLTNPANLTDGTVSTYGYEASGNGIAKYVQIDLGQAYTDIDTIKIFHYYVDGRTFHGTKTQISSDGTNWTTLYDSAVSGEYAETSAGKSYTVHSTTTPEVPATSDVISHQVEITYWNATAGAWKWASALSSSDTTAIEKDFALTAVTDFIGADGFLNMIVYCQYPPTATTPSELFTDYAELDMNVQFLTTRQYLDDIIMKMNVVEEISVLNDAVPSNEISLTLNNQSGDFDVITFNNLSEVIASKPSIFSEIGLVYDKPSGINYIKNPSLDNFLNSPTLADDWSSYATTVTPVFTKANGYIGNAQQVFVPAGGIGGINSGYDSPTIAAQQKIYIRFLFKGTQPNYIYLMKASGNQSITGITVKSIENSDWQEAIGSITSNNVSAESVGLLIAHDTRTTNVDTTILVDEVYVSNFDYYATTEHVEWIPLGRYFITQWKNDHTSKVITFTGNDYFKIFSDTNYAPSAITNLHDLAADVLTKAGVPTNDQYIDSSLTAITVGAFKDNVDSRSAIQQIAIAARCCVYQDRYGNIVISPFSTIDKASNYLSYPTSQTHIPMPYLGPNSYPLMSTGSGLRNIKYNDMYNPPEINLQQIVRQLIVKVYDASGNAMPDAVYDNPNITGDGGTSFSIDNKLVISVDMATKIANWYFEETNYSALFNFNWRQNPALECTDVILVQDPFQSGKQSRIFHQEFDYEGYLVGTTESRGGI